ncbi:MAG: hypothetical protein LUC37_03480 [Prevotella sp.]|nr:hypothetical protein [Prevotella sp.]
MPNRWNAIVRRLHEESGLQYPQNRVRLILEACINGGLDDLEAVIWTTIFAGFLQTCTGKYLDLRGEEIGLSRRSNESDDEYRQRLFNALSYYLSVRFIKFYGLQ